MTHAQEVDREQVVWISWFCVDDACVCVDYVQLIQHRGVWVTHERGLYVQGTHVDMCT